MKKDEMQNTAAFIQDRDLKLTQRSRDANQRGALPRWADTQIDSKRAAPVDGESNGRAELSTRASSIVTTTANGACGHTADHDKGCELKKKAFFDAYNAAAACLSSDDLEEISPGPSVYVSVCMLIIAIVIAFSLGLYVGNAAK